MKKWYFSAALLAVGWLGQAGTAPAQYLPTPLGAARVPEPIPCAAPTPDLVPGPISPLGAPPGPPCGTDLPAGHSSAFQTEEYVPDNHFFVHLGSVGLMRQRLGTEPIAVLDPSNIKSDTVTPGNLPVVQSFDNLSQNFNFGPKLTAGYIWDNQSIEVTGFWLPESHSTADTVAPGQLNQFLYNPPVGFEGDNGLFIHDDRVNTVFSSTMWSTEANYRYTNSAVLESELILGIRYVDLWESILNYTGDDDLTAPQANGNPDPIRQAFYHVQTHNRILGPQIGFETSYALGSHFTVGLTGKAAVGVDFVDIRTTLTRGDGFVGFDEDRHRTLAGTQIYDLGAYLDINLLERMRLRLGYSAMFLVNVLPSIDEFNYNLATPTAGNNSGSIFYHGPTAEFQFLF